MDILMTAQNWGALKELQVQEEEMSDSDEESRLK